MLFATPELGEREREALAEVDDLRAKLRWQLHEPRRWSGSLRRLSFARNIQGSNSIEGFEAALDDAVAVALGEEPLDVTAETRLALEGYRNAMTYVLQLAIEPPIEYSEQLIKSLHFMMTQYDLKNRPGRWRQGAIYVQDERSGDIVYEGADVTEVPGLISDLVREMREGSGHEVVRAAMAHLNLVMIHPFRDGNGRMARALQSMILASEGMLSPVFMSVEEYLGRNTRSYYDVLAEVGQGRWRPENDARPWLRFMLTAHLRQARTLQLRIRDSERLWLELENVARRHALPERSLPALFDAALGLRVRAATYRASLVEAEQDITDSTASRDLLRLVDAGMLRPVGEKRGRYYVAAEPLQGLQQKVRAAREPRDRSDPFA